MINAKQIPDEVVEAARYAFHNATGPTVADDWHVALAAALNAWPGIRMMVDIDTGDDSALKLPLPQGASDE